MFYLIIYHYKREHEPIKLSNAFNDKDNTRSPRDNGDTINARAFNTIATTQVKLNAKTKTTHYTTPSTSFKGVK